jgi:CubicO group peptidase (beta-lactamase class C family)
MKQHRTRLAALAAFAAVAVGTTAPAATADLGVTTPTVSVDAMHANVVAAMTGNAFGWQLAIAKDGQLVVKDQGGTAISKADHNGTAVPMTPYQKMELASVTKNITAVATMKLLRRNGLTVESYVAPYLPQGWTKGPGISQLRFRHLLTHTSGFKQAIQAMPAAQRPTDNSWSAMQTIVANGTTVNSQRQYKNANFALLRVLNAELWDRSGGRKYTTEIVEIENSKGIVIDTKEIKTAVPVTAANHTSYVLDYDRKYIFEPAGLHNIGCIAPGTTTGVHSYGAGATQNSQGKVLGTSSGECAGARGIALSSVQLLQYLVHLRHGSIIAPADLATMDALRAGWNEDSNGGDGGENGVQDGVADNFRSPGVFWHGGDLLGNQELHTCVMTFDGGIEATLLVNSPLKSNTQCGVLIKAWYDAKP